MRKRQKSAGFTAIFVLFSQIHPMSLPLSTLQYPIGKFERPAAMDAALIASHIESIAHFPERVNAALQDLDPNHLSWPYRPGGWSLRQLIHHCADSHMNAFIRFRLALTEDNPAIKPYHQDGWSALADSQTAPVEWSIDILHGLHARWTALMHSIQPDQWSRTAYHPEHKREIPLWEFAALYSWHCNHHLAHLEQGIAHKGQFD